MERLAPEDLVDEWSDVSTSSLGPGAQLGRYELLLPIAYGGMARVWAARQQGQRGFTKTVAIKTILPHLAHNPEFERMFLDEARIAAGVHHPNVTEIYDLGEEGRVLYLAMEWVNGDSFMHVLRGAPGKPAQAVEPRLAARIVADACAGLHAAHELTDDDGHLLSVVHRDVSPHNILVSLEGTVKVTDFGVAKALGQSHEATMAGQVKGKVAYMAPEQIGGTGFDRRADIFGMGCVLYEAVTGFQPFRGNGDPLVMQAVLKGEYERPSKLVPGTPPELEAIIDQALASEPRARFATAERMRVALEEWLAKSGGVLTATQVGALVRQRLGPALERRREHVRAALTTLRGETPSPPRMTGHTPSRPQASPAHQSHSGVVSTSTGPVSSGPRPRAPSLPGAPPPLPAAAMAHAPSFASAIAPSPAPAPLPPAPGATIISRPPPPAGPSRSNYLVAALGGIGFSVLVGGIALYMWRGSAADASRVAPPPVATSAPTVATATGTATATPSAGALAARPPSPSASTAASAAPATIDINALPVAKPTTTPWGPGPAVAPPHVPQAPAASPPTSALPANPY